MALVPCIIVREINLQKDIKTCKFRIRSGMCKNFAKYLITTVVKFLRKNSAKFLSSLINNLAAINNRKIFLKFWSWEKKNILQVSVDYYIYLLSIAKFFKL